MLTTRAGDDDAFDRDQVAVAVGVIAFEVFGVDALRWYIATSMPETADTQFTFAGLQAAVNAELCDTLGNYAARTLKFTAQHLGGKVPEGALAPATAARIEQALREVGEAIGRFEFRRATQAVAEFGRWGNKLFDEHAPWKTRNWNQTISTRS